MRTQGCPREAEVAEAARSGRWPGELVEHSQACVACAEVRLVAGVLLREASRADLDPLPDPRLVWWQARFESRREVARRATRAITVVQTVAATCAAALALGVLIRLWPALRQALGAAGRTLTPAALPVGSADPILVVLVSAVVIGALVLRELAIARARE